MEFVMKVFLKIAVIIIVIAGVLIGAAAVLEKNGYLIIGENGIDFNFGEEEASVYIVTYKVDGVEKQLYVEYDSSYSVDPVPKKFGYKFTGFYDAESGGTQFIDASGMSIGRFREKNDITLYAQFVPEKYTIALDYNGGDGSAFGEYSVSYGEKFPELPSYITVEDKYYLHFAGWMYIDANREPVLITDADGVCDIVFDETLVELLNEDGQFELIAGFETEEYVINFYSKDGQTLLHSETVEYGTHINSIAPKTEDNKVIMKWDKADEDTIAECSTSYYVFTYGYEVTHKIAPSSEKVTVVEENASYRPSTDISRVGYEFVGWFDGSKDITNKPIPT